MPTVKVDMLNIEIVKSILNLLGETLNDIRIPTDVQDEYRMKLDKIVEEQNGKI